MLFCLFFSLLALLAVVQHFAADAERMSPDYARLKGKLLLSIFKVQK